MKWEHKIGIAITSTFLCLVGAVIGLKMQEQPPPESSRVAAADSMDTVPPTSDVKTAVPLGELKSPPPPSVIAPGREKESSDPPDLVSPLDKDTVRNVTALTSTRNARTKERTPFGKKATQGGVSTQSEGTKEDKTKNKNATPNPKNDDPTSNVGTKESKEKTKPSNPVEPSPHMPLVIGEDQWGKGSTESSENKENTKPTVPENGAKGVSPSPQSSEAKSKEAKNPPTSPMILPMGGMGSPMNPPSSEAKSSPAPTPPTAAPTTTGAGTGSTPPPPPLGNSTTGAPPAEPALPSYLSDHPTNAPKVPDSKEKVKTPPSPAATLGKPTETPKAPSTPVSPPAPSVVSPTPMPSASASTTPAPAPPSIVAPIPIGDPGPKSTDPGPKSADPEPKSTDPGPKSTPAPAPPAAPPSPPKPPDHGSSFIPDRSSTATGPVGVKPAPFPLPTPPLASASDKPASPRPASNGPSVTVYDEQDYSCRRGDTWQGISKHFYMTDRYAKALQRHNQNHARASERMRDTGQLAPGERIFVPQAYVLEERYADIVPKPAAAPASTTVPAGFTQSGSPPPSPPPPPANGSAPSPHP